MLDPNFIADWHNHTTLHPLGLLAVVVLGLMMLFVPRRYAVVPMLLMACLVAPAQRVVILSLDFNLLRLMVVFGWTRLLLRRELVPLQWKPLDYVVVAWALSGAAAYSLLYGTLAAMVNRLGFLFDAFGMYFLFRLLVRDWEDVVALTKSVAVLSVPIAGAFLIERSTGRNAFAIFGGVPEETLVRNGRLRCQGAFAHPILAGCFWATLLPLMVSLWWRSGRGRLLMPIGVISSLTVIYACASSTPIVAVLVGGLCLALYPLRRYMPWMRWAMALLLIGLHLAMIKPVWHLLARIDFVSGSASYYRYRLFDEFIRNTSDWFLFGTRSFGEWMAWGETDLTNQYVLEGVNGGFITLALFVMIIILAYRGVGQMLLETQLRRRYRSLAWAIGVSLVLHSATFFAVSYFGQIIMLWYLTLAIVGSLTPTAPLLVLGQLRAAVGWPEAGPGRDGREPRLAAPMPAVRSNECGMRMVPAGP